MENGSNGASLSGYAHPEYAASFTEFGRPRFLPQSQGWILEREIPKTSYLDAMSCYPLFACGDWSLLHEDISSITNLVSLVAVTDPFGQYGEEDLRRAFNTLVIPFKNHFVVNLQLDPNQFIHPHHLRNARRTAGKLTIDICEPVSECIGEWSELYANLILRHNIRGLAQFSPASFAHQAKVPGALMMRARFEEQTVGMTWWFVSGDVAYYHLGAYSDLGYDLRASFVLFESAIRRFKEAGLRWLDLGAGAGLSTQSDDGLSRFKRGWSTGTRTAYLCGHVFNEKQYDELVRSRTVSPTDYFPAYRVGEFE